MAYPNFTPAIVTAPPKDSHPQWTLQNLRLRDPQADEVLVRVLASGICHTDVALSMVPQGAPGFAPYSKVLGHEGSGIVERVGSDVTHVSPGDKVLLSFDYCGKKDNCRACRHETPGYCSEFHPRNIFSTADVYKSEDGTSVSGLFFGQSSFSKMAIVKGTSAVNVQNLVNSEEELKLFAPMGCGYQTGAAAVCEVGNVREGDAIAVFGLGGVGMAALMAAKLLGAKTIIAVDRVSSRLDLARSLGATDTIDTANFSSLASDLTTAIQQVVPQGLNATFDTTGVHPLLEAGAATLSPQGTLVLIGIVEGKMEVDLGPMLTFGTAIRGCIEGNAQPNKFVPKMIEWYRQGKFPIEKLTTMYKSEDFSKALQDMHAGGTIKAILTW